MPRSPDPARARLVSAGERLFAERGIDNVSLREISRESGARNVIALQHHFKDREGLLAAIVTKHCIRVGERRHRILDEYEADARIDLERYSAALVEPLAACLLDDDGGRDFLRIFADLMNRPRPEWLRPQDEEREDSLDRWRRLGNHVLRPVQIRLHRRYAAILYVSTELARCARIARNDLDVALLTSSAIDIVMAIIDGPVRSRTEELLIARDRARGTLAQAP